MCFDKKNGLLFFIGIFEIQFASLCFANTRFSQINVTNIWDTSTKPMLDYEGKLDLFEKSFCRCVLPAILSI